MTDDKSVHYCYAVTRPVGPEILESLRGIGGAEVRAVRHGDVVALTSPVDAEEFSEVALRESLENLAWLSQVAREHNAVVDQVARRVVTLPFRLATIYRDQDRVQEVLRSGERQLTAALDRLEDRLEWGVKVFAIDGEPAAGASKASSASGRAYLRRRLSERDERNASLQRAVETAESIDAELSELADARHRHRAQSNELSGATGQNVLNMAYLVPVAEGQRFAERVTELDHAHPGCRVELTGPWAPYSFALDSLGKDDSG